MAGKASKRRLGTSVTKVYSKLKIVEEAKDQMGRKTGLILINSRDIKNLTGKKVIIEIFANYYDVRGRLKCS